MNRDIAEYVELIGEEFPDKEIVLSTNLNIKPDYEVLKRVIKKLHGVVFSISGYDDEVYKIYHKGGSIYKVLDNMELFLTGK